MRSRVPRLHPALRKGQLVRLTTDGPVHTVVRITPCAAYVAPGDWIDEAGNVLTRVWNSLEAISLHAAVYPA